MNRTILIKKSLLYYSLSAMCIGLHIPPNVYIGKLRDDREKSNSFEPVTRIKNRLSSRHKSPREYIKLQANSK